VNGYSTTTPIHSSSTHTKEFTYFLCWECAERRRRELRRLILTIIFVGIPLVLLVFFLQLTTETSARRGAAYENTDSGFDSATTDLEARLEAIGEQADRPLDRESESADLQVEESMSTPSPRPDQLEGAVAAALDTGKPTAIKIGTQIWPVLVSEPVETSTATCRNVSIEDKQATWCRVAGSDWALAS
jgi:hypothetical protein